MCDKAVDTHPSTITFVAEFVIKQFADVFSNLILFLINIKLNKYVIQLFLYILFPEKYTTQRTCDEAVDNSLAALYLVPDWLVTSKMIKKLYIAIHTDDSLLFFDEDSGDISFCCNEIGLLIPIIINIDNNFDKIC